MHFKNVYHSYLLNYPALFPVICVLVIQQNLAAIFFLLPSLVFPSACDALTLAGKVVSLDPISFG